MHLANLSMIRFAETCGRLFRKDGQHITTTVAQMNFIRWCIENHIIDYIREHYAEIHADMKTRNGTTQKKRAGAGSESGAKTRKKRQELSISATRSIHYDSVAIQVKFT